MFLQPQLLMVDLVEEELLASTQLELELRVKVILAQLVELVIRQR
jgi:hypothetical protein